MAKETTAKIARLAGRFLSGELKTLTRKQQLSLAASALAQAEAEQESVKAWGLETKADGRLAPFAESENKGDLLDYKVIPVLIRRGRPKARKRNA